MPPAAGAGSAVGGGDVRNSTKWSNAATRRSSPTARAAARTPCSACAHAAAGAGTVEGEAHSSSPNLSAIKFDRACNADVDRLLERALNPHAKVMFTVSPVTVIRARSGRSQRSCAARSGWR